MDALQLIMCYAFGVGAWFWLAFKVQVNPAIRAFGILIAIPVLLYCFFETLFRTNSPVWNDLQGGWGAASLVALGLILAFQDWLPFAKSGGAHVRD